jgi:hypothetical protein
MKIETVEDKGKAAHSLTVALVSASEMDGGASRREQSSFIRAKAVGY